jgi:hypothetical protein
MHIDGCRVDALKAHANSLGGKGFDGHAAPSSVSYATRFRERMSITYQCVVIGLRLSGRGQSPILMR